MLAEETAAAGSARVDGRTAFRVCERLRRDLNSLVGVAGFRSLLARALTLAKAEVSWLKEVQVGADGSLEGLTECKSRRSQAEFTQGEVVLVAHLLGLLMTFIGESLTLQLVQAAWPDGSFGEVQDGKGET